MSVETLKTELANLDAEERRELIAFLLNLNRSESEPERKRHLAAILDNGKPGAWLGLQELDARLDWK
jgi:hypothetical protein